MRSPTRDPGATALSQINVTPLVDVMLVLLIIFMISAPALTSRLPLDLPQVNPPEFHKKRPEPPMLLKLDADGALFLDGHRISEAVLAAELAFQSARDAERVLAIEVERDARYDRLIDTLASARDNGIKHIAMPSLTP